MWVDLRCIMLSEKSQNKKATYHVISGETITENRISGWLALGAEVDYKSA